MALKKSQHMSLTRWEKLTRRCVLGCHLVMTSMISPTIQPKSSKIIVPEIFLDDLMTRAGFAFVVYPEHRADYQKVAVLAIEAAFFQAREDLEDEKFDEEDGFELASVRNGVSNVMVKTDNYDGFNECVVTVTEYFG
ncbi:hypothetical protein [Lactiplantibacillus plantarum]|uniref:hypothetical protein n=1 Tax=Lactiplantibacillus plantarum TaxID=1590 RepID=UPI0021A2B580|nr:hypothetical protein [Lactiplantibacillus plantarum]